MLNLLKEQDDLTQLYIKEIKSGKQAVFLPKYKSNHELIMKIVAEELEMEDLGMIADYQKETASKLREIEKEYGSPSVAK